MLVFAVIMPAVKGAATCRSGLVPVDEAKGSLRHLSVLAKLSMTEVFLWLSRSSASRWVGIGRVEVSAGLHGFIAIAVGSL